MLFDEPFSGVDPVATDDMRAAIQRLAEQGKSVLFSSHLMDQAERICHDVVVVDNGRVLAAGPLAEVTGQYGRRSLEMEFDGDAAFLERSPLVARAARSARHVEVEPAADATPNQVVRAALDAGVEVTRFAVKSPSLHEVFVRLVGGDAE